LKRLALLIATGIAGLGLSAPIAHAAKGDTLLVFEDVAYDSFVNEALYRGRIHSDQLNCLADRDVTVYRKRAGKDDKIGTTQTFADEPGEYEWSLLRFKQPKDGNYYATTPTLTKCKGDKSNTAQFVD
jgi:hypothetical protein